MTSRVWVSFNSDTVVSTTPETPFFVGNPSFGAHRLTHRMRLTLFALLYVVIFHVISVWLVGGRPIPRRMTLSTLVYLQSSYWNVCSHRRPGGGPRLIYLPRCVSPTVQWFPSFPVTHRILIPVPPSPFLYHTLAFYFPGIIVSMIGTGFLIKVYTFLSFSLDVTVNSGHANKQFIEQKKLVSSNFALTSLMFTVRFISSSLH